MMSKCARCGCLWDDNNTNALCPKCNDLEGFTTGNPEKPKDGYIALGWECPKCGSVMAPFQGYCVRCTKFNMEITY